MNNQNKFNQNQIESQVNPWEISDADLNHINLEHLNDNTEAERVRNEIEQSRDISVFHIEGLNQNSETLADNREAVLDIYEKQVDDENSNIFQERRQELQDNVIYLADYGVGFYNDYEGREGFIARNENRNLSQQELNRKVIDLKQEKRKTNQDLGRKVFKALTGDISA